MKLKYVQQPVGRRAGLGKGVIRPSKRIVYDANEAIVCFLADEVEGCVTEFLEEWAKVSKIVVIAREGQYFSCLGRMRTGELMLVDIRVFI